MKVDIGEFSEDGTGQDIRVEIHHYDTWSMDYTLAPIIYPMLLQLKDTKQGIPLVDAEDVPWECTPITMGAQTEEHIGEMEKRWNYVLDVMLFSFDKMANHPDWQLCGEHGDVFNVEAHIARGDRMQRGFTLFGKYYQALWD